MGSDGSEPGPKAMTAGSIFPRTTKYFGASEAAFMVNYRVDNLDALLEELKKAGVEIDPHREDYDYGRFAWIMDPRRKSDRDVGAAENKVNRRIEKLHRRGRERVKTR